VYVHAAAAVECDTRHDHKQSGSETSLCLQQSYLLLLNGLRGLQLCIGFIYLNAIFTTE